MLHELRIYDAVPGRMPDVLRRFETITLPIWKRHGIVPIGFWTYLIGPSNGTLTYLLQWESLADRESKWGAFQTDPEWIEKRARTEADGPIVANISNAILQPTWFSPLR